MAGNFNYSEDSGYVDIYGKDIRVLVCNKTGSIAVPLDELKQAGFRLYRKSQYSRLLIDDNQFEREFFMYMLSCAQTYMLQKQTVFKENDILENINKCKAALIGNQNNNSVRNTPPTARDFAKHRVVEDRPDSITITANLKEVSTTMNQSVHNDRNFRGFVESRSPTAVVNSNFSPESRQNIDFRGEKAERSFVKNNAEHNQLSPRNDMNGFDQRRNEPRKSFQRNNDFEQGRPQIPRPYNNNTFVKNNVGKSNGAEQRTNFNRSRQEGPQSRDFEGDEKPVKKVETIELNKSEHNVLITYIEKPTLAWVQDVDNADVLLEIDSKVKEEIAKNHPKVTSLVWNKIYLALLPEDNMWYRCRAIKFKPLTVYFVDYGNTAQVTEVREASEYLANIPCQAVKITFNGTNYSPELYESITVRIRERFENGTYAVDVILKEEPFSSSSSQSELLKLPAIPTFFTKPKSLCELEDGQKVMLVSHNNGQFALRTRECYDKLKHIERALDEVEAKPVEQVEKAQIVLYKKDKLQRAVVTNAQKNGVEIELLDYYDKIKTDLSSLRHINEDLAKQPLTYVLTPQIKAYDDSMEDSVRDLCQKKAKAIVVLSSNGDFDLNIGGELLSNKFKTQDSDRPMLKDFKAYSPPIGVASYLLNVYENKDNIYFASEEILTEYLECVMKVGLEDEDPYVPIVGEVCLGLYQDSWSRCVVLDIVGVNYEVRFIDFGNTETLKTQQLRKLTDDAKKAPILVFCCRLTGLPSLSNIEDSLKENLSEGNTYDVNIKKLSGTIYDIEISSVLAALKK